MFPDIDVSGLIDQFAGIADYMGLIRTDLPGLYSMFNESLPEEVLKIATDLDMTGTGAHIKEGVAQGMTEAGWATDAETVAANLEAALNSALGIQSPSTRMKPTGSNVAAGVGAGMDEYGFTGEASSLAGRLSGVISAMRSAARAAINAAKSEFKIKSPSRVFEEEVGVMAMKGLGQGVLKESKAQAKIIHAARYLTGEAKAGCITIITQAAPEVKREIWKVKTNGSRLMLRSGTGTKYKIIGKYKNGTKVVSLEKTTSSWYNMLTPDGKQGFMSTDWLQYVRTEITPGQGEAVNEVVEARQLRDQSFRIYRVVPEFDMITVYARHVFYDLMDNMIRKYEPSATTTGANVAQGIASGCLSEHDFTVYSDFDSATEQARMRQSLSAGL